MQESGLEERLKGSITISSRIDCRESAKTVNSLEEEEIYRESALRIWIADGESLERAVSWAGSN